jgi:hypothetical protein
MQEFVSSGGKYHKHGHMFGFADLCDWKTGHSKQIHEQFKYILKGKV